MQLICIIWCMRCLDWAAQTFGDYITDNKKALLTMILVNNVLKIYHHSRFKSKYDEDCLFGHLKRWFKIILWQILVLLHLNIDFLIWNQIDLCDLHWGGCTFHNMYEYTWVHKSGIHLSFFVLLLHMLHKLFIIIYTCMKDL